MAPRMEPEAMVPTVVHMAVMVGTAPTAQVPMEATVLRVLHMVILPLTLTAATLDSPPSMARSMVAMQANLTKVAL